MEVLSLENGKMNQLKRRISVKRLGLFSVMLGIASSVMTMDKIEPRITLGHNVVIAKIEDTNFAVVFKADFAVKTKDDTEIRTIIISSGCGFDTPYPEIEKFRTIIKNQVSMIAMAISDHFLLEKERLASIAKFINSIVEDDMLSDLKKRQENTEQK